MLQRIVLATLNHLLSQERWARERLRPFAGQHARVEAGALAIELAVGGDGLLTAAESGGSPAVVVVLPADAPFRYLVDPTSVFAAARLQGSADFAESLAFVFRNLRWEVEDDLARVVGDMPARRLVQGARAFAEWQRRAATSLIANMAEYATEESALLTPRRDLVAFCSAVEGLQDDVVRLEKRLAGR